MAAATDLYVRVEVDEDKVKALYDAKREFQDACRAMNEAARKVDMCVRDLANDGLHTVTTQTPREG